MIAKSLPRKIGAGSRGKLCGKTAQPVGRRATGGKCRQRNLSYARLARPCNQRTCRLYPIVDDLDRFAVRIERHFHPLNRTYHSLGRLTCGYAARLPPNRAKFRSNGWEVIATDGKSPPTDGRSPPTDGKCRSRRVAPASSAEPGTEHQAQHSDPAGSGPDPAAGQRTSPDPGQSRRTANGVLRERDGQVSRPRLTAATLPI